MTEPLLELRGLTKRYGDVLAVAPLDLVIAPGEVVALVGENGAGKSTVVNMVGGVTQPSGGSVCMDGREVNLDTPRAAREAGIGVVQQHYALVPGFTVAETMALGEGGFGRLNRGALRARVEKLAAYLGLTMDPDALIGSLDVAGQQRVEILRALSRDIRLLVLDEPTAVLTPDDATRLFENVARLRAQGIAVLLVTHKLSDVFRVCDRAAVLHDGRLVADRPVAELDEERLVSLIITGEEGSGEASALASTVSADFDGQVEAPAAPVKTLTAAEKAPPVLSVSDILLRRANGSVAVASVTFDLHPGEILGVAGVDGNGQSELMQCLAGLETPAGGHVAIGGLDSRDAKKWNPAAVRRAGVAHVPDDRRRQAISAMLSLAENFVLSHLGGHRFRRGPLLNRARARSDTQAAIAEYGIRTTGPDQTIGRLSGGNQQKLVLARELLDTPRVLLTSHPSRGLDVRTIAAVQERLRLARTEGAGVILVSADMGEIMHLADRVMVFAEGKCLGPVDVAETDTARIGSWMTGRAA